MPKKVAAKIHQRAHAFREGQTEAEAKSWSRLRGHKLNGVHFRRQHPIGEYIVDICAPREKLIIEVDGSQHLEYEGRDRERTKYLEAKGYKVIRFWNTEVVNHIEEVIVEIERALKELPPPASPI
jgi:very-short-patch-repair endonuclease